MVGVNDIGIEADHCTLKRPGKGGFIGSEFAALEILEQLTFIRHHIRHARNGEIERSAKICIATKNTE